uniref:RING-type E3 ubiquitin transferase n=1 Tax=Salvator merianae TaxID=96440 RepID=A0A8D0B0T1_SALMN
MPGDNPPEAKCPICLDSFENLAFLDNCGHKFCFTCIQEWSKNKTCLPFNYLAPAKTQFQITLGLSLSLLNLR